MDALWDSPIVSSIAFQARRVPQPGGSDTGVVDVNNQSLGWRVFRNPSPTPPTAPVFLFLHGNAETVDDVQYTAPGLFAAGAAGVLALDWRGYGWSSGSSTLRNLVADMRALPRVLPALLAKVGFPAPRPLMVYGRSMGATAAAHVVANSPVRGERTAAFWFFTAE